MNAALYMIASLVLLIAGCAGAVALYKMPYRRGRVITSTNCLMATVFVSDFVMLYPLFAEQFGQDAAGVFKSILISIHTSIRLFVMDGDFELIMGFLPSMSSGTATAYSCLAALLYVMGPLLTFGFILSFFRNVTAYRDLYIHFRSELYVFSELNEKSLYLAESIKSHDRRSVIVFTDVSDQDGESGSELLEAARELKAICFKKDITDINWNISRTGRSVYLFAIAEEQTENLDQSVQLAERYGPLENFRLFVFASGAESEMLFNCIPGDGMRIRRIDPIRTLIDHSLYESGGQIFQNAADVGGGEKLISVVLLGLGQHGTEMLKSLAWFCQMDGYRLEVNAFDRDPMALDRFTAECPELMAPDKNGVDIPGESRYRITIHPGVDVGTVEFRDKFREIRHVTYVFAALGSDAANIETAVTMRMLSERNGVRPHIQAIVYASHKKAALEKITDYRGHPYEIDFVGDMRSSYSRETIVESQLYQAALERHLKWGDERDFWAYEFNFHSSVAAAIHLKMRKLCGMPGSGKKDTELTTWERDRLEVLEHRRWNAYMRSEGYIYSGSTDKGSRNDLAKMHNDLIPFEGLDEEEKRKDSIIGTE